MLAGRLPILLATSASSQSRIAPQALPCYRRELPAQAVSTDRMHRRLRVTLLALIDVPGTLMTCHQYEDTSGHRVHADWGPGDGFA